MINKKQTIQKGFTLIEVLIAVFILITAVVVPLTIGSKGIFYSNFVRDQSIASYLVQEGMEYVRLQRDNIFLAQNTNVPDPQIAAWGEFTRILNACGNREQSACFIGKNGFTACSDGLCEPMYVDDRGRYVTDGTGEPSKFTRTIKTQSLTEPLRMRVDVTVSWKTNTLEREITVTNYLMPWQI